MGEGNCITKFWRDLKRRLRGSNESPPTNSMAIPDNNKMNSMGDIGDFQKPMAGTSSTSKGSSIAVSVNDFDSLTSSVETLPSNHIKSRLESRPKKKRPSRFKQPGVPKGDDEITASTSRLDLVQEEPSPTEDTHSVKQDSPAITPKKDSPIATAPRLEERTPTPVDRTSTTSEDTKSIASSSTKSAGTPPEVSASTTSIASINKDDDITSNSVEPEVVKEPVQEVKEPEKAEEPKPSAVEPTYSVSKTSDISKPSSPSSKNEVTRSKSDVITKEETGESVYSGIKLRKTGRLKTGDEGKEGTPKEERDTRPVVVETERRASMADTGSIFGETKISKRHSSFEPTKNVAAVSSESGTGDNELSNVYNRFKNSIKKDTRAAPDKDPKVDKPKEDPTPSFATKKLRPVSAALDTSSGNPVKPEPLSEKPSWLNRRENKTNNGVKSNLSKDEEKEKKTSIPPTIPEENKEKEGESPKETPRVNSLVKPENKPEDKTEADVNGNDKKIENKLRRQNSEVSPAKQPVETKLRATKSFAAPKNKSAPKTDDWMKMASALTSRYTEKTDQS